MQGVNLSYFWLSFYLRQSHLKTPVLNENDLFICTLSRSADNNYLSNITQSIEKLIKMWGEKTQIKFVSI